MPPRAGREPVAVGPGPREVSTGRAGPGSVVEPIEDTSPEGTLAARISLARRVLAGSLAGLGVGIALLLLESGPGLLDLALAGLFVVLCLSLFGLARDSEGLARRRQEREAGFRRFAQGLSRSMSPEAVVDAVVADLRSASDADHVVVARVRQPDESVEVTLVATHSGTPPSRTLLRPEMPRARPHGALALLDPDPGAQAPGSDGSSQAHAAAEEIARRVRSAYALPHTLAWPLISDRRFLGALILSRRSRVPWGGSDRRLISWAAEEVSAAFARAYALEAAERGANLDALTGLPNRRYFDEILAIERPGRRAADGVGILMVDIDRFKRLNDRYGHATGDRVLRAVALAIAAQVRAEDTPARFGGEEFAVLLRRASADQATEIGERVRSAVARLDPSSLGIGEPVTVSVGIAVAGGGRPDMKALVEQADQALYRAKRLGRDRVVAA